MKLVIFDIDGTLADLTHRLHYVTNGNKDWDSFFAQVGSDAPIWEIINLLNVLAAEHRIVLVSGRNEETREATEKWLHEHEVKSYAALYMRPSGDFRQDFIIKKEILGQIKRDYPEDNIVFVVDDRPPVVKMWREEGLICLQCAEWKEPPLLYKMKKGLLTLMVGPSGAGKSCWLNSMEVDRSHIISSDQLRADMCGDFRNQNKNKEVFAALHALVRTRIDHGLPCVVDATNIKRADRMALVALAEGQAVWYIVIDRPMKEKLETAGWRTEVPGLIERHDQTFRSQLKEILVGDNLPNVTVVDMRKIA